jgi:uncharacterized protein (DUF849 family)
MLLQAALNGRLPQFDHPAVPVILDGLAGDAVVCVAARAQAYHLHPRDSAGHERFDAATADRIVTAVRRPGGRAAGNRL